MRRFKVDILAGTAKHVPGKPDSAAWTVVKPGIWAGVKDLNGKDYYASMGDKVRRAVTFDLSYDPEITEDNRVRFEGRDYRVTRIYEGTHGRIQMLVDAEWLGGALDS